MKTAAIALVALAAACAATPAAAQSQSLLDCATGKLSSTSRSAIADAAMHGGLDRVVAPLNAAVKSCAGTYDLTFGQHAAYYEYSLTRVQRDEFSRRLAVTGISTSVIDDAVGFGPGRANPVYEGSLPDEAVNTMYRALRTSGVDVKAVSNDSWALIGVYMQASSTMWNAVAKLR